MTNGNGTPSHAAPPPPSAPHADGATPAPHKITPRDVASATAVGAASRLGVTRHRAKVAEGAAAGVAGKRRPNSDRRQLMTALAVTVVMIGMLVLMIVLGK